MKNLALAAICGMFHFELASEEDVDPDIAVQAMEEIFYYLQQASTEEMQALREAVAELKAGVETGDRRNKEELVAFYDNFPRNLEEE